MAPESPIYQALRFHQQGQLAQAEKIYLQILGADPANFDAQHLLGTLRSQQGRNSEAIEWIGAALKTRPRDFGALSNHGLALMAAGRLEEALTGFDKALAIWPDFIVALYGRGTVLLELKCFPEALTSFQKALALQPNHTEALHNSGVALAELNQPDQALIRYDQALKIRPDFVPALRNRGNALWRLKRVDEALASFDAALKLAPDDAATLYNQGVVLADQMRLKEALDCFTEIATAKPDHVEAQFSRGNVLRELKSFDAALAAYDSALRLRPDFTAAWSNRAVTLWHLSRCEEAVESYDRALALEPDLAIAWTGRGQILGDMGRPADALASYGKALAIEPGDKLAWNGRGVILRVLGRFEEAVASLDKALLLDNNLVEALVNRGTILWSDLGRYQQALTDLEHAFALDPGFAWLKGDLLHLRMFGADWHHFNEELAALVAGVRAGDRVVRPFAFQALSGSPADLQTCSRIFAEFSAPFPLLQPKAALAAENARCGHPGKIRVGYLSAEFREQATAYLTAGLYELHDRNKFEVFAFDNGASDHSPMRRRLEAAFDGFFTIRNLSDPEAAEIIRRERIDILVNLNGYFGAPRTGIFAIKPAPVQVNYLGFPATMGAAFMDYILADHTVIPEEEQCYYTEAVAYLPDTYQINDSKRPIASEIPTRHANGLPENAFVYCNFNQSYKLTPDVFETWMRILRRTPRSVLWLLDGVPDYRENLTKAAEQHGVSGERLIFAKPVPADRHLARLKLGDLFLDGLPYNAHTTASDALWAGLPLLTRRGTTFPGRVAASLLKAAGLPELITETPEEFERMALELASDTAMLAAIKEKLARNRLTCPLFDTGQFCRHMEAAFAKMREIAQRGDKPHGFSVA